LAICASQLRDLTRAREEMRAITNILPKRAIFRDNLAFYSNYQSDFAAGEEEARAVVGFAPTDTFSQLALAQSQSGQGQIADAIATFTGLARVDADGKPLFTPLAATISASGLGDLAVYEGRFADAVRILEQGAAANLAGNFGDRAAAKYAKQAYAQLLRGQKAPAVAAAEKALANSKAVNIRFLAARVFVEAGQPAKATALMKELSADVHPEPQAYGKIIEAQMAMTARDPRSAIKLLTEANELVGTDGIWIGHFDLGRAYLASEQFLQADSEFDRCIKRRGEALSLFLDEEPTFGYFPMVYYYQGRVKEGLKQASAAETAFRAYLTAREKAGEDPLVAEIKKRLK
jgi:tetratricopeptide (TPR) repeat protein